MMKVEFSENISKELKDSVNAIIKLLDNLDSDIQVIVDNTSLRVNESEEFQCDNASEYRRVFLSRTTVDTLWLMAYSHVNFYDVYCKTNKMDGNEHVLNNPKWKKSKKMLNWIKDKIMKNQLSTFDANNFPKYGRSKKEINIAYKYAVLFFIAHELYHLKFAGKYPTPCLDEEKECDHNATKLILNNFSDGDYIPKAKGVCIGLMYLNMVGIYGKYYDGITHPLTYDRLINNLKNHFGKENDNIWKFVVSIFALHMTNANIISKDKNITPSTNYLSATLKYKKKLEEDINKSAMNKT